MTFYSNHYSCLICTSNLNQNNPMSIVYKDICADCYNRYHVCKRCTLTFPKSNNKEFYIHTEFTCMKLPINIKAIIKSPLYTRAPAPPPPKPKPPPPILQSRRRPINILEKCKTIIVLGPPLPYDVNPSIFDL
jgi:hypothetical protein